jgi:hypothetical protein
MRKPKTLRRTKKLKRTKRTQKRTKTYKHKKNGGDGSVNYVISSHGVLLESKFRVPDNVTIIFYCRRGEILYCSYNSPKNICSGKLPRTINEDDDIKQCQTIYGGTETSDYHIYKDEFGRFGEIFRCIDDEKKEVQIPWKTTLSKMIKEINKHSKDEEIIVHCLFCRA